MLLESYRPFELYLITEHSKCEYLDILSIVFSGLLSRNILQIEYRNVGGRVEAYKLKVGLNFNKIAANDIDQIFLNPFIGNPQLVLPFEHALIIGLNSAQTKGNLIRLGLKSTNLINLVKYKYISSLFGKVNLNKNGKAIFNKIKYEIKIKTSELEELASQNVLNPKEILTLLKGKYYYFQSYNITQLLGANYGKHLEEFKSSGYDVQHELNFAYFKERLKYAHIELLKFEYTKDRYDEFQNEWNNEMEDGWDL